MTRKTIAISAGIAAIAAALTGTAIARDHGGHKDPFGDRTVTSAELQAHAAQMFAKHDANKDGKLDAADRAVHHGAMFERLDTDRDGSISRAEFDAAHQGGMPGEHRMGEHGRGKHGGKMRMMVLHTADANADKAVSQAEFTAAHLKHFNQADTDKDGKLTPAERQAAHAKMREQFKAMRGAHAGHGTATPAPAPAPGN